jgi:hypothetical protein
MQLNQHPKSKAIMDTVLWKTLVRYLQTPLSFRGKSQEGNTASGKGQKGKVIPVLN